MAGEKKKTKLPEKLAQGPEEVEQLTNSSKSIEANQESSEESSKSKESRFADKESKLHGYGTLIAVAFAYLLVFVGYIGTEALQTHINSEEGMGTTTIAIVYGTFFLSCFGFGPFVLGKFGPKWCIVIAWIFYSLFIAANLYPKKWTLYPTAATIGFAGSVVWIGMNMIVTSLALEHSKKNKKPTDEVLSLFNGIFMGIMFFQYAISAFISSVVFYMADLNIQDQKDVAHMALNVTHAEDKHDKQLHVSHNISNRMTLYNVILNGSTKALKAQPTDPTEELVCGAKYCAYKATHVEHLNKPDPTFIYINISIFLGCSILGMVLLSFQRSVKPPDTKPIPIKIRLKKLLGLLINPHWFLIAPTCAFIGFMQGLSVNTFSQAYINCAVSVRWVAYVLTVRGMTYMMTCFLSGRMNACCPRWAIFITSYVLQLGVIVTWLILRPSEEYSWFFFIIQGVEGAGSASLRVQASALVGYLFPYNQEIAFAHFNMGIALPTSLIMAAANFLCFDAQAYIAIGMLCLSMLGFILLHFRLKLREDSSLQKHSKASKEGEINL